MPIGYPDERPLCSIEGCGKSRLARGWCPMHYERWRQHGDPLVWSRTRRSVASAKIEVEGPCAFIPLTQGKTAIIDVEDLPEVGCRLWQAHRTPMTFYAYTKTDLPDGYRTRVGLHRLILQLPASDSRQVDHINQNGLDNRRANLRAVTKAQNMHNRKGVRNVSSVFKGVFRTSGSTPTWIAQIGANGKQHYLGRFGSEDDAARAYDAAARELHGGFARLNFPELGERQA